MGIVIARQRSVDLEADHRRRGEGRPATCVMAAHLFNQHRNAGREPGLLAYAFSARAAEPGEQEVRVVGVREDFLLRRRRDLKLESLPTEREQRRRDAARALHAVGAREVSRCPCKHSVRVVRVVAALAADEDGAVGGGARDLLLQASEGFAPFAVHQRHVDVEEAE